MKRGGRPAMRHTSTEPRSPKIPRRRRHLQSRRRRRRRLSRRRDRTPPICQRLWPAGRRGGSSCCPRQLRPRLRPRLRPCHGRLQWRPKRPPPPPPAQPRACRFCRSRRARRARQTCRAVAPAARR
eukprot:5673844-Prymnesium_polylepis.2